VKPRYLLLAGWAPVLLALWTYRRHLVALLQPDGYDPVAVRTAWLERERSKR